MRFVLLLFMSLVMVVSSMIAVESDKVEISIPVGLGASSIAASLKSAGLISSTTWFKALVWFKGAQKELKAGDYLVPRDISTGELIELFRSGKAQLTRLLVKEGTSAWQLAQILHDKNLVDRKVFYDLASSTTMARVLGVPGPTLEGYLFPDTYQVARGVSEETILRMMVERFKQKVSQELLALGKPRLNARKVVTLASVVEKEAAAVEELPRVASVFLNRMKNLKRLESCATVRFALNKHTGPVLFKDLEVDSPYNTYRNFDLPPGPICSPGLNAIRAAVEPEKSRYMFFVVAGDGRHHFSETFEEHKKARARYLRLKKGVVQN